MLTREHYRTIAVLKKTVEAGEKAKTLIAVLEKEGTKPDKVPAAKKGTKKAAAKKTPAKKPAAKKARVVKKPASKPAKAAAKAPAPKKPAVAKMAVSKPATKTAPAKPASKTKSKSKDTHPTAAVQGALPTPKPGETVAAKHDPILD